MTTLDLFTRRRLERFVQDFRQRSGQLPTLKDLGEGGFGDEQIRDAIKHQVIEEFYVTLTSGTIVKGYKIPAGK